MENDNKRGGFEAGHDWQAGGDAAGSRDKEASGVIDWSEMPHGGLMERLRRVKKTRWIRFTVVSLIFFGWVAWLGSWWVLAFWLLLIDIYLTQFIPWAWWKHLRSKTARSVMSWVDAIVYALIVVYFLFLFVGQNYTIPSSSLEKTLLTGDFLWVNKMVYGPRVPQTPLHFPLAQNELLGHKSYIEWPQWDYHRLKGVRRIQRGDIVVFNFPAGDTVAWKSRGYDLPTLAFEVALGNGLPYTLEDLTSRFDRTDILATSRQIIDQNPDAFGKVTYLPVDRRENFVKRCLGLPGDWLRIVNGVVYINGKALKQPKHVQYNYVVEVDANAYAQMAAMADELGISNEDLAGSNPQMPNRAPYYTLPLTGDMVAKLRECKWVHSITRVPANRALESFTTYPIGYNYGWDHNNYGAIWIPKKGATLQLSLRNLPLYARCIKNYEGNALEVRDGKIYINGKVADRYTFKMDYYWMQGDNRDNSLDSRFWGFVPEDHIVGTPMIVLISFNKDKGLFSGKVRWNRVLRTANPDK